MALRYCLMEHSECPIASQLRSVVERVIENAVFGSAMALSFAPASRLQSIAIPTRD